MIKNLKIILFIPVKILFLEKKTEKKESMASSNTHVYAVEFDDPFMNSEIFSTRNHAVIVAIQYEKRHGKPAQVVEKKLWNSPNTRLEYFEKQALIKSAKSKLTVAEKGALGIED